MIGIFNKQDVKDKGGNGASASFVPLFAQMCKFEP